jgi:RNA polymerase sigma factor (sigma-70 family)
VARLGHASTAERRAAFDELARAYRPAVLGYLRRRWHLEAADAEDAAQALLLQLWERDSLETFDPDRARFRTFLRVCIDRHALNRLREARTLRRGGGSPHLPLHHDAVSDALDARSAEAADENAEHAEACFQEEVARAVLARAIARLQHELVQKDRAVVFEVLRRYDLEPAPDLRYAQVADALGVSVTQVTNHLHSARRRLRALALEEVRAMCANEGEYRAEARELVGVSIA